MAPGTDGRDGDIVQERRIEDMCPVEPGKNIRSRIRIRQIGTDALDDGVLTRPIEIEIDSVVIASKVLVHAEIPLPGRLRSHDGNGCGPHGWQG